MRFKDNNVYNFFTVFQPLQKVVHLQHGIYNRCIPMYSGPITGPLWVPKSGDN